MVATMLMTMSLSISHDSSCIGVASQFRLVCSGSIDKDVFRLSSNNLRVCLVSELPRPRLDTAYAAS